MVIVTVMVMMMMMMMMILQENWHNGVMNLQLLDGGSWAVVSEGATVPLKIMSIDTGAGRISFPEGAITGSAGLYREQRVFFCLASALRVLYATRLASILP